MGKVLGVIGAVSGIITILVFLTGKASLGDFTGMEVDSSFVATTLVTTLKTVLVGFALMLAIMATMYTAIFDILRMAFVDAQAFFITKTIWSYVWGYVTIEWFWQSVDGISFLVSLLIIFVVGSIISVFTSDG